MVLGLQPSAREEAAFPLEGLAEEGRTPEHAQQRTCGKASF